MAATPAPDRIAEAHAGMSLADYLARGDERFEIIDGEEVAMSPSGNRHDTLKENLYFTLRQFAELNRLGSVMIEHTFIAPENIPAQWVSGAVVPDISFVTRTRMVDYQGAPPLNPDLPMALIPDLVIEIVSPTDRRRQISRKIDYLLDLGGNVIWLINPGRESAIVYTSDADPRVLTGEMLLTTDLLPGWSIIVHDLFSSTFGA